jgi:hypothetical protein
MRKTGKLAHSRGAFLFASESWEDEANKVLASEPDLRQMKPLVDETSSITIRSSTVAQMKAKRNPGTIEKLQGRSRISLRSIRATTKKIKGSGTP